MTAIHSRVAASAAIEIHNLGGVTVKRRINETKIQFPQGDTVYLSIEHKMKPWKVQERHTL